VLFRSEMLGFANLMFAGGRDTVIHSVACAIGYLAEHPEAFELTQSQEEPIIKKFYRKGGRHAP